MGKKKKKKYLIETLPVPVVDNETMNQLEYIIDSMIAEPEKRTNYIENINSVIYSIFDFSAEEIDFIENMVKIGAH